MLLKLFNYFRNKYLDWKQERALYSEIDRTTLHDKSISQIVQDAVKYSYAEGLAQVKKKINELAKSEGHVKLVEKTDDFIKFAEYEDAHRKLTIESLKQAYVYSKEKPKEEMIDNRINQYYELQSYTEKRQLIKAIKKARKDGDEELARNLEREWTTKYRRITTS